MMVSQVIPLWQMMTVVSVSTWILIAQLLSLTQKIRSILQPLVNRQVEKEAPVILSLQSIQHPSLDAMFTFASYIVSVEFYTAFLPLLFWSGHEWLARQMTLLMAICIYAGNSIKDLVSAPRPPSPPVRKFTPTSIEKESSLEYLFRFLVMRADGLQASMLWPSGLLLLTATILVIYGRMYLGMHSPVDIIAGIQIGITLVVFWCYVEDYIDFFIMEGKSVLFFWTIMAVLLLAAYPTPKKPTPSFEYHTAFNGVVLGMVWGMRLKNCRHLQDAEALPILHSWSASIALLMKRLLVGLPVVAMAKLTSKYLALRSITWISIFVGLPIRSSTYLPELNGPRALKTKESDPISEDEVLDNYQRSFWPRFYHLGFMEPLDVDTGVRLLQYAVLSFSVVEVCYLFQLLKI
ncbi:hypothetical protein O6H91_11G005000 [Diphasiastrum complanatum]|uniref:Uncharacterized protein n=1 Tax=Diphasiastrum complanatum TaxID=34168 RepID=A0ACC2C606_DIPCM|nr:hypothetical protein O6H91_11G005000 [Diphasiastrum complanatum]